MHNKQAPPPMHMCQPSVYLASLELMKSPYLHTGSDERKRLLISATGYVSLKFSRTPCAVYYAHLQMLSVYYLIAKYRAYYCSVLEILK